MSDHDFPEPKDLGQAILLLSLLGQRIGGLTQSIESLRSEMVTRPELQKVHDDLSREIESIKAEMRGESAASQLKKAAEIAQQVAVIAGVVGGIVAAVVAIVHFWDKLPK